jgi:WD40 repeat protein
MLTFSRDSRTLYFTTTLGHHIQAYSIPTAELLPPFQAHPSPPNVLAISHCGDVLLSASPRPPTILIQDLRLPGSAPISFVPRHSTSAVTCASFHDDTRIWNHGFCLLALGFQDGTLTLYRLSMPPLGETADPRQPSTYQMRSPARVASIKKLHKPAMGGVYAAEFIPGYKARVVSIASDGRCRIVDFQNGGEVLRT